MLRGRAHGAAAVAARLPITTIPSFPLTQTIIGDWRLGEMEERHKQGQ